MFPVECLDESDIPSLTPYVRGKMLRLISLFWKIHAVLFDCNHRTTRSRSLPTEIRLEVDEAVFSLTNTSFWKVGCFPSTKLAVRANPLAAGTDLSSW